ncbi:gamma subclass chorismate mutase AroQ [Chryseobacterium polytrichastri]|uniref:chorismate mutase n=1 Tax=Chryseobacterium polytrichastri TaxID=1302687 RepID=A0A1M7KDQ6_9FLAO|nr:gamma subclass chorismate mutase AroQ [Chryseobacterium polytrichastri]SHM63451.1 chorismate mutase [Chryseobacterium polytrichastri]
MKEKYTVPLILMIILCLSSCIRKTHGNSDDLQNKVLLTLIDKRLQVAPLVAKSKWNTQKPIDDPVREKIILDSVEVKAEKMNIDTRLASAFFQAQFEAGKMEQRRLHKEWKSQNQGLFDPVPDLATEVRPVLDNLTPQLLIELKKLNTQSEYCKSLGTLKTDARKTIDSRFSDEIVNVAIEPIEKYCREH